MEYSFKVTMGILQCYVDCLKWESRYWCMGGGLLKIIKAENHGAVYQDNSTHLDTSFWELLSPSRVNGDAPVRSSNIRIPRLHQSTDWEEINWSIDRFRDKVKKDTGKRTKWLPTNTFALRCSIQSHAKKLEYCVKVNFLL